MRTSILQILNIVVLCGVAAVLVYTQTRPPIEAPQSGASIAAVTPAAGCSPIPFDEHAVRTWIEQAVHQAVREAQPDNSSSTNTVTVVTQHTEQQSDAWREADQLLAEVFEVGEITPELRQDFRRIAPELHPEDLSDLTAALADAMNRGELPPPEIPGMLF
ncbi:MAG: hypothetical protein AAFV53_06670 [Myxococcota bacterium]